MLMPMQIIHWLFPFFEGIVYGAAAMILHECGHILLAAAVGIRVTSVGIRWKGMYTVRESGPPGKNIAVSLAGPAINLLLTATWFVVPVFALANLCMGLCNLLPIPGSDGERVLNCWRAMKREKADEESGSTAL